MGDVDQQRGLAAPRPLAPGLYLLATPIGAARDITLRGLDALAGADLLAAEDTRTLLRLMELHGVQARGRHVVSYHEHNAGAALPKLLAALEDGGRVVYASEAGTPLIADPGFRLAREARTAGYDVWALPGPSAALAALVVSGMPTDAFAFLGFPPSRRGLRRRYFERWAAAPGTLVIYEAGSRLGASLADMAAAFGDRPAALARELTKRHEQVVHGTLCALAARIDAEGAPKGEIVVLVDRPPPTIAAEEQIDALLVERLAVDSLRDAVRTVSEHLSAPKKVVYDRALKLTREDADDGDGVD